MCSIVSQPNALMLSVVLVVSLVDPSKLADCVADVHMIGVRVAPQDSPASGRVCRQVRTADRRANKRHVNSTGPRYSTAPESGFGSDVKDFELETVGQLEKRLKPCDLA